MTGVSDSTSTGDEQLHAASAGSEDHAQTSGPPAPTPASTALSGRSNVYEKYLNKSSIVSTKDGLTPMGRHLMHATSVREISNSNDDVEAGEVVCTVADDAGENQENEPPAVNSEASAREKGGGSVGGGFVAPASPHASSPVAVAAPEKTLTGAPSCSPSAVDLVQPDDEPAISTSPSTPTPTPTPTTSTSATETTTRESEPTPAFDTPTDAVADGSADAAVGAAPVADTSVDTVVDTAADVPVDASVDGSTDASVDASVDAVADNSAHAAADAAADAFVDAIMDTADDDGLVPDVPGDPVVDTGADVSTAIDIADSPSPVAPESNGVIDLSTPPPSSADSNSSAGPPAFVDSTRPAASSRPMSPRAPRDARNSTTDQYSNTRSNTMANREVRSDQGPTRPGWQAPQPGLADRRAPGPDDMRRPSSPRFNGGLEDRRGGFDGPGRPGPGFDGPGGHDGPLPSQARGRSRSRSRGRDGPPMNNRPLDGPPHGNFHNGRPPSPGPIGGSRGWFPGQLDGRARSPPRNNNGFGPPGGPRGGSPPRNFRGRQGSPPRGFGPRGESPPRNFNGRPGSPMRGPPRDFRGGSPPRGGRPGSPMRGPGPNGGPPFGGGQRGMSPPRQFNGRPGSPPRGPPFGRDGPPMGRGPSPGPGGPRRSRSRSPGRGPPRGRSPPRDFRGPGGPDRGFRGSPPRGGFGGPGGPPDRNFRGSPPRDGGRFGGPPGPMNGPPRSPPRGGNMMNRPGSPGRFQHNGPPRSPPRDGFRGPPPNQVMPPRPGSPGFRGPPPNNGGFSPRRDNFGGFDNRGPPPGHGFDHNRGPPPGHNGFNNGFNNGPPPGHGPFPPRGRSRSRSPQRKRDRSWERPQLMDNGMMMQPMNMPPPDYSSGGGSAWIFELKRSGRPKFRCRAMPTTMPFHTQLPLSLDIVQLPRLQQFRQFLMLDRGDMKRIVYEMRPDSIGDRAGYDEFRDYLMRGREGERAGLALELERAGYKVFVLPPGAAARSLGYKAEFLIAVIRRRG